MHDYLDEEIVKNVLLQTAYGLKVRMLNENLDHSSYEIKIDHLKDRVEAINIIKGEL